MESEQMEGSINGTNEDNATDPLDCFYMGTDHIDVKIWLIGVFAVSICIVSVILNSFFSVVFWKSPMIRKTPVYYFGILAFLDIVMALNYVIVIAVPVYFDYYESLLIYHMFLNYFRFMLTETAIVMFASMLLIVLATTERLLKTFHSRNIIRVRKNVMAEQFNVLSVFLQRHQQPCYMRKIRDVRKFLEKNRPLICIFCVFIAIMYKSCQYFELTYEEKTECEGFARYEITLTELSADDDYRFWWMFVTRNVVDRIAPFFLLVIMNVLIIKALKKEYKKIASEPKASLADTNGLNNRANKPSRSSLRDATRALISLVTTYLISQSLQVFLTFWEAIDKSALENEYVEIYNYLNDLVSILPLIAGCIRYPIYCACNKSISKPSVDLLKQITRCIHLSPSNYFAIGKSELSTTTTTVAVDAKHIPITNGHGKADSTTVIPVQTSVALADAASESITDDSEQEWQL